MRSLLSLAFLSLIVFSCEKTVIVQKEEAHWDYEHPDWQQIGYASCGGNAQSPIDVVTGNAIEVDQLPLVDAHYQNFQMKIVDNGHAIQVMPNSGENYVLYNGVRYNFAQFHFHNVSEHKLNGNHEDMEMHVVHSDDFGNLLVLAFMIEPGVENPFLQAVLEQVPAEKKKEVITTINLNLQDIMPSDLSYYTYYGSLTTPPCTASVQFIIFKDKVNASSAQINGFAGHYDHNYRPVQPLNNRFVFEKNQ